VYARDWSRACEVARLAVEKAAEVCRRQAVGNLLVNATPLGSVPAVELTPFPGGVFDGRCVYDLVYNPPKTRLLAEAAAAGCETLGGLGTCLIAQGRLQSEWWTGRRPPDQAVRHAALARLKELAGTDENYDF